MDKKEYKKAYYEKNREKILKKQKIKKTVEPVRFYIERKTVVLDFS